jgi:hypothetical protein
MLLYAIGTGVGFGLTVLAVTVLLLNYYGRQSNLELFSLTCLVGAVSAGGPFIAGAMRDRLGRLRPDLSAVRGRHGGGLRGGAWRCEPPKAPQA